ncbi:hypothetical protein [Kordia jejudonensis]|uniref:hypothetical protein n=1 Tax=Kordia jejudonensis TaxID=1348245 RepID=UPI000629427E|nr:hypothetical protein [Kordia jejudonensis]
MEDNTKIDIDDSAITWKVHTSEKGEKYEVGYLSEEEFSISNSINSSVKVPSNGHSSKEDFGVTVNWPVADSKWKNTVSHVKDRASITHYALYVHEGFRKHKLWFKSTKHYKYTFYDETGDGYVVNTFRNGKHYVRFNSKRPRIVYITGS